MYISNVKIKNYRNFKEIEVPLSKNTILLGINDIGKTNLLEAINLVLFSNKPGFFSKRLSEYDFNMECVHKFNQDIKVIYSKIKDRADGIQDEILKITPKIEVELEFKVDSNDYVGKEILNKFLYEENEIISYRMKYEFFISNVKDYIMYIYNSIEEKKLEEISFSIPTKYYDYKIYSVYNDYEPDLKILKRFKASIIYANRDSFSTDENLSSTNLISKIISEEMNETEKTMLIDAYKDFFKKIKGFNSFKEVFSYIDQNEIKNVSSFINNINLVPNAKKYQNVLSNISISYGDEMLFQKGLGTRNLIFIFTLFSYFVKTKEDSFNLLAIEEPESHLSVDNYKLVLDYVVKTIENNNTKNQLLITSHSNQFINKIDMANITVICSNDKAINLGNLDEKMQFYLSKRSNFDILKLLLAKNVILVEGVTEELYLNTVFSLNKKIINDINIVNIGQTGFTKFMDIWLKLHKKDESYKLGVVKDYDNRLNSKLEHLKYSDENDNIKVAITNYYTFEDDLVKENNLSYLNKIFNLSLSNDEEMISRLKEDKADSMLTICLALKNNKVLNIPSYLKTLLRWFSYEID